MKEHLKRVLKALYINYNLKLSHLIKIFRSLRKLIAFIIFIFDQNVKSISYNYNGTYSPMHAVHFPNTHANHQFYISFV